MIDHRLSQTNHATWLWNSHLLWHLTFRHNTVFRSYHGTTATFFSPFDRTHTLPRWSSQRACDIETYHSLRRCSQLRSRRSLCSPENIWNICHYEDSPRLSCTGTLQRNTSQCWIISCVGDIIHTCLPNGQSIIFSYNESCRSNANKHTCLYNC